MDVGWTVETFMSWLFLFEVRLDIFDPSISICCLLRPCNPITSECMGFVLSEKNPSMFANYIRILV